jgi:hypothetical protein
MALSHSSSGEKDFLAAEEARACRKYKREERSDNASRSQSAMGAAGKYLSTGDACKSARVCQRYPQVDLSEDHVDSTGRQRVIGMVRRLK